MGEEKLGHAKADEVRQTAVPGQRDGVTPYLVLKARTIKAAIANAGSGDMGTVYLIVLPITTEEPSLMHWVKSPRAWTPLMSGQGSQDMEIRGLDANSDQTLVEQIQVSHALINTQGQADPRKKLELRLKKNVVLDPCQSVSRQELARQAWKAQSPHSSQHPNSQRALWTKESWTPPSTESAWAKPSVVLIAYSWLPASSAFGPHSENHQYEPIHCRLALATKAFCPFDTTKVKPRKWQHSFKGL